METQAADRFLPLSADIAGASLPSLEKARQARDPRFDGVFFVGVTSTGIFCRPVCPVRLPKAENVTFFFSAAGALAAGFRPCRRCRPESAPGSPAWLGTETTVRRALRLIEEGALDNGNLTQLCDRLGVGARHLGRLFQQHLGVSPGRIAQTRRLLFAKKLITETSLKLTDIALAAGYGSVRRCNSAVTSCYGCPPTELRRRSAKPKSSGSSGVELELACRRPFNWPLMLNFFRQRATPGVETVEGDVYRRMLDLDGSFGHVEVSWTGSGLRTRLALSDMSQLLTVAQRLRRQFDLDAAPQDIHKCLAAEPVMRQLLQKYPGIRLPGTCNGFEAAVRAIVGQQISVAAATAIMGRIAAFGEPSDTAPGAERSFPRPEVVAEIPASWFPMPGKRAEAILELARRVARGDISFFDSVEGLRAALQSVPGIGPWTASYAAMRISGSPDEFLADDLVIKKQLATLYPELGSSRSRQMRWAEQWRPFRSYAVMYLWQTAAG